MSLNEEEVAPKARVTVLGAGVIGLTTAVLLQGEGFQVKIVAKGSPEKWNDDDAFTSPKAGAHWRSMAGPGETQQQQWDKQTFQVFQKLANIPESGVIMVPGYEMFRSKPKDWKDPWFSGFIPHYKQSVPAAVLGTSKTTKWGISYSTATFDVPVYLKWLLKNFKAMGGKIAHRDVKHIHELFTADTDIIINCSGLGSRFLGGVMDKTVYPIRGQTVVVRAPQVQYTITQTSGSSDGIWNDPDDFAYIIPRQDGLVILGGTYDANNFSLKPDEKTGQRIIESCCRLSPELKSLHSSGKLDVVSHKVGLRPGRKAGVRLEGMLVQDPKNPKRDLLLVHNYGHGGFGYQSSWGCAESVLALCSSHLTKLALPSFIQSLVASASKL